MPQKSDDELISELVEGEEVQAAPWPLILRDRQRRIAARAESSPNYRLLVLLIVLTGFFANGFSITVVSVSLPTIGAEFGVTDATVSWVLTGALFVFGIANPTMGRLGDLLGHKRLFVGGMFVAGVLAVFVSVAWSAGWLIFFRLLWAVAAAAAGPSSMALIMEAFGAEDRVKAMGWWSFVGAGAPVIGVVAGGPVVEQLSWRWIFAAQVPVSLLAATAGFVVLRNRIHAQGARFDIPGTVAVTLAFGAFLLALNRGGDDGWSNPLVLGCLVVSPAAFLAFWAIEKRARYPLLPPALLKTRNFRYPLTVQFFGNFAYMGAFLLSPFLFIRELGYSLTQTGLFMLPRPIAFSLAAPVSGYIAIRLGERRTIVTGMFAIVLAMLLLSGGAIWGDTGALVAGLVLSGVGLGGSSPSITSSVANSVPADYMGVAGAAISTCATVGGVTGMEALRTAAGGGGGVRGYAVAYLLGGVAALMAAIGAFKILSLDRGITSATPNQTPLEPNRRPRAG